MNARPTFIQAALSIFPDLAESSTITRKQVVEICNQSGCPWPAKLTKGDNRVDGNTGLFHFSANRDALNDTNFNFAPTVEPEVPETDEEMRERIKERYFAMEELVEAVANNAVNSLIIAGAPGLGKSFETNKILSAASGVTHVFHRGYLRATHLFRLLWENRLPGQTIVIDDCDSIFEDQTALNILKAALELKEARQVSWGSEKEFLDSDNEVIPRTFEYDGSVIFLTNLPFSDLSTKGGKNAQHLAALDSRSLVLDLKIRTPREIMCKVMMTIEDGMLRSKGVDADGEQEIIEFMNENVKKMKEISLRSAEKLAALYLLNPTDWKKLARTVCLK